MIAKIKRLDIDRDVFEDAHVFMFSITFKNNRLPRDLSDGMLAFDCTRGSRDPRDGWGNVLSTINVGAIEPSALTDVELSRLQREVQEEIAARMIEGR